MFKCETRLICDNCGRSRLSEGERMSDCCSKLWHRRISKKDGWKTLYGEYDVCPICVKRYGIKYLRMFFFKSER